MFAKLQMVSKALPTNSTKCVYIVCSICAPWGKSGKFVSFELAKSTESVKVCEGFVKRSVKLRIMRSPRQRTK